MITYTEIYISIRSIIYNFFSKEIVLKIEQFYKKLNLMFFIF